jgi:hypothetical protein
MVQPVQACLGAEAVWMTIGAPSGGPFVRR